MDVWSRELDRTLLHPLHPLIWYGSTCRNSAPLSGERASMNNMLLTSFSVFSLFCSGAYLGKYFTKYFKNTITNGIVFLIIIITLIIASDFWTLILSPATLLISLIAFCGSQDFLHDSRVICVWRFPRRFASELRVPPALSVSLPFSEPSE